MAECNHKWIANSGQGGMPIFKGREKLMHVHCDRCNSRTWMNESAWDKLKNNT